MSLLINLVHSCILACLKHLFLKKKKKYPKLLNVLFILESCLCFFVLFFAYVHTHMLNTLCYMDGIQQM